MITEVFAIKNKNNTNSSCNVPIDPYTSDGIVASNYTSSQIKTMQTKLSNLNPEIKAVIDGSGGVDGIIGAGFKQSYNMARKSCLITSISNIL